MQKRIEENYSPKSNKHLTVIYLVQNLQVQQMDKFTFMDKKLF